MASDRLSALTGFFRELVSNGPRAAAGAALETYTVCPGCGARVERWVELDPNRHKPDCLLMEALRIVQWRYAAPEERPAETLAERKEWLGPY